MKKRFLLRLDERVYEALERWADDELRSVNAQIEYLLQDSLKRSGRLRKGAAPPSPADGPDSAGPE